jgi:hypothetical protein
MNFLDSKYSTGKLSFAAHIWSSFENKQQQGLKDNLNGKKQHLRLRAHHLCSNVKAY